MQILHLKNLFMPKAIIMFVFRTEKIERQNLISIFFSILALLLFSSCNDNPSEPVNQNYLWEISTPDAEGMDKQKIDSAFIHSKNLGYVDGLLVIRNGKIVAEKYFNGYDQNTAHNVKSVSKSFLSAIVGIALREGYLSSLDLKVLDYFSEYVYQGMDERKKDITIKHLMTMRMGIDTEENNLLDVLNTSNWIKTTIELPLLSAPGEKFRYNTLETHLLSAILSKEIEMDLLEFARKYLFEPMGITIHNWMKDPQGYYFGGSEMYFTPRNMAVLGYLYLNKGKLNGKQIVPADWVDLSLTKTWEKDSKEWGVLKEYNYGYLWWLGKINGYKMFWALGYGGQTVLTFPDLNLIVVTTAGYNIGWDVDQERPILEMVSKYVLPAIKQ